MKIADSVIGDGHKAFIIAEIGQAHDGSLGLAHSFIDAVADAGADAVKFQTHIAAAESTKDDTFRIPMSGQDATRYDYWKRMEFTAEQWHGLDKHAVDKGLVFLSSAFSVEAVALLEALDMPAWKVGSGEFKSDELLDAMMATGKPVLYSTGMSTYGEIDDAVELFKAQNVDYAVFQCTSQYPNPLEDVGLNVLGEYKGRYGCPVGLSDHSGSVHPSLAAIAQGANLIEVHVTFDKRMYGPDASSSVTFSDLEVMCRHAQAVHMMHAHPVDKDQKAQSLSVIRGLFTKSLALKSSQKQGCVLTDDMLTPKKPGTGIAYTQKEDVIGKVLKVDVSHEHLLKWEDFVDGKA